MAKPLLVYVVDDDEAVRTSLVRLVRSAGLEPRGFGSAAELIDAAEREQPACVLLDITMPGVTGLQAHARMKEKGIDAPVIVISARDEEKTREVARELGANFYLSKPVDDHALLDAIAWVTGNARAAAGARR